MKRFFVIVVLAAAAVALFLHREELGRLLEEKTRVQASGVASQVVDSGREVGNAAGKAFRSIDFGGKR